MPSQTSHRSDQDHKSNVGKYVIIALVVLALLVALAFGLGWIDIDSAGGDIDVETPNTDVDVDTPDADIDVDVDGELQGDAEADAEAP